MRSLFRYCWVKSIEILLKAVYRSISVRYLVGFCHEKSVKV